MLDVCEVMDMIVGIVIEGRPSTRYSGETIVSRLAWECKVPPDLGRRALRRLFSEGTICYAGKYSMIDIRKETEDVQSAATG